MVGSATRAVLAGTLSAWVLVVALRARRTVVEKLEPLDSPPGHVEVRNGGIDPSRKICEALRNASVKHARCSRRCCCCCLGDHLFGSIRDDLLGPIQGGDDCCAVHVFGHFVLKDTILIDVSIDRVPWLSFLGQLDLLPTLVRQLHAPVHPQLHAQVAPCPRRLDVCMDVTLHAARRIRRRLWVGLHVIRHLRQSECLTLTAWGLHGGVW
eukprot:2692574-Prymnesium_polylepis.2